MIQIVEGPSDYRAQCQLLRGAGSVALVPTMGALHRGHAELIRHASQLCDAVAVTIFVNPTQFGPGEDLERYPRTLDADLQLCQELGVSLVFTPSKEEMYQPGDNTRVRVSRLTDGLCGADRPNHFEGVTTIVCKLLSLTGPCTAVFGRKDYQQLRVVQRMARDLFLPAQIVDHPIVREADGVALSSRNRYLSAEQRVRARGLVQGLAAAQQAFQQGVSDAQELQTRCRQYLDLQGLDIDYVSCVDATELTPLQGPVGAGKALLAVAARVGGTRLIDNCLLGETELAKYGTSA